MYSYSSTRLRCSLDFHLQKKLVYSCVRVHTRTHTYTHKMIYDLSTRGGSQLQHHCENQSIHTTRVVLVSGACSGYPDSPRRADATYDVENYQGPATPTKNAIIKYLNFHHISVFKF